MSDLVPFPAPQQPYELCLVGIRLDPTVEGPQMFALIEQTEAGARTVTVKGRILLFSAPALVTHALELVGAAFADSRQQTSATSAPMPKEVDILCDVAQSLYLLNSGMEDSDGVLLDCIACLDDLLGATELNVPANFMAVLNGLAERLEQNPEFGSFLAEQGIDRETLEDAILWCVGAVAVKSTWIG
jgi:hypothetical protein